MADSFVAGLSPIPNTGQHGEEEMTASKANYFMARIREEEDANMDLQMRLEASRQRELHLYKTVEGFKELAAKNREQQKLASERNAEQTQIISELQEKLQALVKENESLRSRLDHYTVQRQSAVSKSMLKNAEAAGTPVSPRKSVHFSSRQASDDFSSERSSNDPRRESARHLSSSAMADSQRVDLPDEYWKGEALRLRTQLEQRTKELNETYCIIGQLKANAPAWGSSSVRRPASPKSRTVAHERSTDQSWRESEQPSTLARRNAVLELRVAELERQLKEAINEHVTDPRRYLPRSS